MVGPKVVGGDSVTDCTNVTELESLCSIGEIEWPKNCTDCAAKDGINWAGDTEPCSRETEEGRDPGVSIMFTSGDLDGVGACALFFAACGLVGDVLSFDVPIV